MLRSGSGGNVEWNSMIPAIVRSLTCRSKGNAWRFGTTECVDTDTRGIIDALVATPAHAAGINEWPAGRMARSVNPRALRSARTDPRASVAEKRVPATGSAAREPLARRLSAQKKAISKPHFKTSACGERLPRGQADMGLGQGSMLRLGALHLGRFQSVCAGQSASAPATIAAARSGLGPVSRTTGGNPRKHASNRRSQAPLQVGALGFAER